MKIINSRSETMGKDLIVAGVKIFDKVGYEIYLDTIIKIEQQLNIILVPIVTQRP